MRTHTVNETTSYVNLVQAVASCGGSHSQICVVVAVFIGNMGSKKQFFLLLVT